MAQQIASTRHLKSSTAPSQQRGPVPPVSPVSFSAAPCLWHSTRTYGRKQSCQASSSSGEATAATSTSRAESLKKPVELLFKPSGKSVQALPGEYFADAAQKAGVDVQLGCNLGNCGVCELELEKFSEDGSTGTLKSSGVQVIRSCIARIPPGYVRLELNEMADQIWGVDGFDT